MLFKTYYTVLMFSYHMSHNRPVQFNITVIIDIISLFYYNHTVYRDNVSIFGFTNHNIILEKVLEYTTDITHIHNLSQAHTEAHGCDFGALKRVLFNQ